MRRHATGGGDGGFGGTSSPQALRIRRHSEAKGWSETGAERVQGARRGGELRQMRQAFERWQRRAVAGDGVLRDAGVLGLAPHAAR